MPTPTPAASPDPRRNIPRMDELLQLPEVESARQRLAEHAIRAIIQGVVTQARRGQLPVSDIPAEIAQRLEQKTAHSLQPVINATGVIIHTNLGRAPLPSAAVEALQAAASYTCLLYTSPSPRDS